jgi:hypothetical protein
MEERKPQEEEYGDILYETLRGMSEAQGLLRKAGEEPNRDNKVLTEKWAAIVPKAYRLKAEILEASKNGIDCLTHGDQKGAEAYADAAVAAWKQILELPVPEHIIEEQLNDTGQEVMETLAVFLVYPAMTGDFAKARENLSTLPMPDSPDNKDGVYFTVQQWLAGLEDTPSELGKMMRTKLIEDNPQDLADYEARYVRMYKIAVAIYNLLEKFESQNTRLLNNTHRRFQGFKEKLGRVANFIERIQERIIDIRIRKLS